MTASRASDTILLPGAVWLAGVTSLVLLAVPFLGLASRVPWGSVTEVFQDGEFRDALWLSLRTSFAATVLTVILGTPLALWIARSPRFAGLARVVVILPMALPPVVAGLALLSTFGRRGLIGAHLAVIGIEIGFTTLAVVIAQTFVAMPFYVVAVEAALRGLDPDMLAAARALGAQRWTVIRRVALPLVAPALASGVALSFARALGEFGATLTFAGSLRGTTRTMPLAIYLQREAEPEVAYTLAVVLILTAVAVIAGSAALTRWLTTSPRRRRSAPAASPSLSDPRPRGAPVHASVVHPDRGVDCRIEVDTGASTALVGPNGAGKSTVLREIAGLLHSPESEVRIDGRVVAGARHSAAPRGRGVALLTQRPALFPTMTVLDNVAFGPRARGAGRREAAARGAAMLEEVGARHLADRLPRELSGGEEARVALARALVVDPTVLLLDEPLAALDVESAAVIRKLIARLVRERGMTTILSTHAASDVAVLADGVVVLERGRVVEAGPARAVLSQPESAFARQLAGVNRLDAVLSAGPDGVDARVGGHLLPLPAAVRARLPESADGGSAGLYFAPADVRVVDPGQTGLPARVRETRELNHLVSVHLELGDGQRFEASVPVVDYLARPLAEGAAVHVRLDGVSVRLA